MVSRVAVLAFCVAGIWSAYITQGVLQETLSTKRFGPEARRFDHLAFLNFAQNVVCFVWSFISEPPLLPLSSPAPVVWNPVRSHRMPLRRMRIV